MRQKGCAHLFLLVILVVAAIGAIGYLAYQNAQPRQEQHAIDVTPTQALVVNEDKNTYFSKKHQFSFDYPGTLNPYELSNGVVSFLPTEFYDACKTAHESENSSFEAFEPCNKAIFNFNGFETNPDESYEDYVKDNTNFATFRTFKDGADRTWNTGLGYGQVYNFDAFTEIENIPIKISFQYGFNAPAEGEVFSFFNQILSTFKFAE